MKLLGKFNLTVANQYQELLEKEGIKATIVKMEASGYTMTRMPSLVNVNVPDEFYEKAVGIIKSYEKRDENKVKEDLKQADGSMLQILMVIIAVIILLLYLFRSKL